MAIFDRLREFHDDIVFRRYPDIRRHAPLMFSALFLIVLVLMFGSGFLGGAGAVTKPELRANIVYPTLGAELRLSRFADRPAARPMLRAPIVEADANDPRSPMVIDIDTESAAVHASAGTIDDHGTPINIGSWPLD